MYLFLLIFFLFNMSADNLDSLIRAEKSFSALSASKGIKAAFLANLDDDAILFIPRPAKGRHRYAARDTIPGNLIWEPEFADISFSYDLGYTTGPWILEHNSDTSYGHFVSVWERKNTEWKVILDTGVDYPLPFGKVNEVKSSHSLNKAYPVEGKMENLSALDKKINSSAKYNGRISANFILLRNGTHPLRTSEEVYNHIRNSGSFEVLPDYQRIASSSDLAYSYGSFKFKGNKEESYLRIWIKSSTGDWLLALELSKSAN